MELVPDSGFFGAGVRSALAKYGGRQDERPVVAFLAALPLATLLVVRIETLA